VIPRAYITEWRSHAPWSADAWVEQDLVISRALVEMFAVPQLQQRLAFRGGTALHKLHVQPPARYSEDIDLVQVRPGPIGETLDLLRRALDPWLGEPKRVLKEGRANLLYRFDSEDATPRPMRLKVEINTREHFTELGLLQMPLRMDTRWFSGSADITTFALEELLGTKLRALYQRKKGRDLFDLALALDALAVDPARLIACFDRCMAEEGHTATRAQFEANLYEKALDRDFRGDIVPLLRPGVSWDFDAAMQQVLSDLVTLLPGEPWKRAGA